MTLTTTRRALWCTTATCWTAAVTAVAACAAVGVQIDPGRLLLGGVLVVQVTSTTVLAELIPSSEAIAARQYLHAVTDGQVRDLHRGS
jgi:hypothetical protein